ncbi:hypothetical protein QFZ82_007543 [Streptomyces sp. V4I23]|uniref:hypothetical protein n=1 Tax=Streptomyces sp. V4I23 TaxID=3042282 RepID=UPI00277FCAFF|nr:hypothetical protein [Streptomyces sp. V4I23]MDQ1013058.1 hypothetical protein [Streptomyces sp. V4I23]
MLQRRTPVITGPELDDRELRRTLTELRPAKQLHGLGAGASRPPWEPVAKLLRATGRDWDRRVHRISVLAPALPPLVTNRWIADRPKDPDALVVRAYARVARADGAIRSESSEAYNDCIRAAEAMPEDPSPWLALLDLMYACGAKSHALVPLWTEAVNRDPWNRTAYHRLLRHLSPRGHGTLAEMLDFARHSAARAPHGSPIALLPLAARAELVAHREGLRSTSVVGVAAHWNEPQAAAEIDTALAKWFHADAPPHAEALADLNLLAFALTRTHRRDQAALVFRRIGRRMTSQPWDLVPDPVGTFLYWRDRVCG